MKVLVTGASGFVGKHLLNRIRHYNIAILGRKKVEDIDAEFYCEELANIVNFSFINKDIDVIIHCAARVHIMQDASVDPLEEYRKVNTLGTLNLARQAAGAGVKRFIFISSIKVNGESTELGKPFTAFDKRQPQDFYGQSKSEAEELLLQLSQETGMEVVIIRPTLVYGAGVKANFAALMDLVAKGIPLPFGMIKSNRRSLVSVENLVDLIVTCIEHPEAANQVFLVSDDEDISTFEMVDLMATALGKKNWQLPLPLGFYRLAAKLLKKEDVVDRLIGSLQVDIRHTKETLNWTPSQSLADGFKKTASAFLIQQNSR